MRRSGPRRKSTFACSLTAVWCATSPVLAFSATLDFISRRRARASSGIGILQAEELCTQYQTLVAKMILGKWNAFSLMYLHSFADPAQTPFRRPRHCSANVHPDFDLRVLARRRNIWKGQLALLFTFLNVPRGNIALAKEMLWPSWLQRFARMCRWSTVVRSVLQ